MAILRSAAHREQKCQLFPSLVKFFFSILSVVILASSTGVTHAATLTVNAGADLQAVINAARPGDTIMLEAGASFTGPFTLPNKGTSTEWITIRTSTTDSTLPSATTRISPSDSPLLAKLLSPGGGQAALQTAPGAHHYRLIGLEVRTANASNQIYDLIELGDGSDLQNTLDKVPHHLILDHCLITAFPTQILKRGVALHSSETTIQNCYIAGFKSAEQDAQAIAGWNGPGPFHIINNYLEGSGENLLFGGSTPAIAGLVPSDIEIKGNYLYKPLSWRKGEAGYAGVQWSVKNLFELKSARRVVFEGNVLENCWGDVNSGYGAINLTVRGDSGPQATLEDITIRNNVMKHTGEGFNIMGKDDSQPSQQGRKVTIENNLFLDIDGARWKGDGNFIKISEMPDVTVNHNTVIHSGDIIWVYGSPLAGFTFTNNIIKHNTYGIIGQNEVPGMGTINDFFPGAVIKRSVIAGNGSASSYPSDNFFAASLEQVIFNNASADDYSLAPVSPYKGQATDGKDVGYDSTALGAVSPSPSITPSPTPTPTLNLTLTKVFGDDFNDNQMDTTKWYQSVLNVDSSAYNPSVTANEQNQRFEIKPVANTSPQSHNGYVSVAAYDFTRARASVQVLQAPDGGTALAVFTVGSDSSNWYRIATKAGQIYFQDMFGGVKNSSSTTYNAAQHQYWRIRHDDASDMILFETSADGVNWSVQRTVTRQLSITAMRMELDAGTYEPVSAPGTAVFDNFELDTLSVVSITPTPTPTPTPSPSPSPSPTPRPALTSPALISSAFAATSALAANVNTSAAQLAPLVTDIEQAYAAFFSEASNFAAADQIDKGLRAALYFVRASYALCAVDGASVKVQSRLQIAASRLSQVNNLILSGSSNLSSADATAHATSSSNTVPIIGSADTRSSASFAQALAPSSLGTILGDPNQSPLSMKTTAAASMLNGNLPYELAGVSVTVSGRAAQVLSVSPSRVNFLVPAGLPVGDAEVLVTLQEGYVSRGMVTIAPISPGIFTTSSNGVGDAVALDSIALTAGPFDVTRLATSDQDKRTRLTVFTTGLSSGLVNTNTSNDLVVLGAPVLNLAESVRAEARTRDGRLFNLAVEYAGRQSSCPGLDQVNIVLPLELKGAGAVELTVLTGNLRSNTATVSIK